MESIKGYEILEDFTAFFSVLGRDDEIKSSSR